jgi:hypothetical protein
MTNEEAIDILRNAAWLGTDANREQIEEAVEMAINALFLQTTLKEKCLTCEHCKRCDSELANDSSADVVPYSIAPDGTLTITVPKGIYKKVNRVLVGEDGTHWGGLYYAD